MGEIVYLQKYTEGRQDPDPIDLDEVKSAVLRLATRGLNGEDISSPLRELSAQNIISILEILAKSHQSR